MQAACLYTVYYVPLLSKKMCASTASKMKVIDMEGLCRELQINEIMIDVGRCLYSTPMHSSGPELAH